MALVVANNPLLPVSLQPAQFDYAKGWNSIALALAARLGNLPLIGSGHAFLKWIKGSAESREWQNQFIAARADGKLTVNTWMIGMEGSPLYKVCPDDSARFSRRTVAQIYGYLGIEDPITWDLWSAILMQVPQDLINGDRTLGKACLTHSLPESATSEFASFCNIDCHSVMMKITIEEEGAIGMGDMNVLDSAVVAATGEIIAAGAGVPRTAASTIAGSGSRM